MWIKGLSIEDIALKRNLAVSTISNYLNIAVNCGLDFTKTDLMRVGITSTLFDHIAKIMLYSNLETVQKEIKCKCLPEEAIKLMLSYVRVRVHLTDLGIKYRDPDCLDVEDKESNPAIINCKEGTLYDEYFNEEDDEWMGELHTSLTNELSKESSLSEPSEYAELWEDGDLLEQINLSDYVDKVFIA